MFSLGDASSLPNSKTAAVVAAQAPVLVDNLVAAIEGRPARSAYDGYASCPLLTGHGELMLCEFKYGGVPKETFAGIFGSQDRPARLYYHLKKDFFVSPPRPPPLSAFPPLSPSSLSADTRMLTNQPPQPSVYWNSFVKGTWFGPNAWKRPDNAKSS